MSYVSHAQDPRRKIGGIAGTIAINATIGVLVVTGLSYSGFVHTDTYDPILQFPTPPKPTPPPPEVEPQPTPSMAAERPVAPLPPIPLPPQPGPQVDQFDPDAKPLPDVLRNPDPGPSVTPTPRPAPSFTPKGARPDGNPRNWITTDDYPARALRSEIEGTARYRVVVGTNGRVSSCEIVSPTGNAQLDQATCRLITRRAQFEPATDENGAKVLGTYSGTVRWEIPR